MADNSRALHHLVDSIMSVIKRHNMEYDLSEVEIIGVMELVKSVFLDEVSEWSRSQDNDGVE